MDTTPDANVTPQEPHHPPTLTHPPPADPLAHHSPNMTDTLEQVRLAAQRTEEKHQADMQQLRDELLHTQAQQQAAQAAEIRRILDERAQEERIQREEAQRQWQRELNRQQQEAAEASLDFTRRFSHLEHQQTESRREQARMAETSQGTQLILTDILRKLSELTTNNRISQTPNQTSDHVYPAADTTPEWDTAAQLLPAHIRNGQLQYRDRAIYDVTDAYQTDSSRPAIIHNFLQTFRQTKQRDPHASDFPHYRSTDLAPDTTRIDYQNVYLPTILNLALRLATLGAQPTPADPLYPGTLETQATHHRNWNLLRDRLASPTPEPEELEFSSHFWAIANRPPTSEDIPTWSRIILTQNPPQGLLLNYYAFRRAAFQHVLETYGAPSAHTTPHPTGPTTPIASGRGSPTDTLPTYTPLTSSPVQQPDAPPTTTEHATTQPPLTTITDTNTAEPTQPTNRTAVTTSPDLTLRRRARTTEDKATSQATAKEQTRTQRRSTRGTTTEPTPTPGHLPTAAAPNPPRLCCNHPCLLIGVPIPKDFFCATTGYPMHSGCSAPASRKVTLNGLTFQCRSCADPSPT